VDRCTSPAGFQRRHRERCDRRSDARRVRNVWPQSRPRRNCRRQPHHRPQPRYSRSSKRWLLRSKMAACLSLVPARLTVGSARSRQVSQV
jgi:hypothetical protein